VVLERPATTISAPGVFWDGANVDATEAARNTWESVNDPATQVNCTPEPSGEPAVTKASLISPPLTTSDVALAASSIFRVPDPSTVPPAMPADDVTVSVWPSRSSLPA